MMEYEGHLLVGSISSLIFIVLTYFLFGWFDINLKNIIILLTITYLYSLLPDIDLAISRVTWHFIGISIILIALGVINKYSNFLVGGDRLVLIGLGLLILTFLLARYAHHRGWVHTIWAGALFSLPIYLVLPDWTFCILGFICFWSHLCADGEPLKI